MKPHRVTQAELDYLMTQIQAEEKELLKRYKDAYYNEIHAREEKIARMRSEWTNKKARLARYKTSSAKCLKPPQ